MSTQAGVSFPPGGNEIVVANGGKITIGTGGSLSQGGTTVDFTGLTSTVTELNKLHGMTTTTAELNLLHGAGSAVASGTQVATITAPSAGGTIDSQARTAITAIIAALVAYGIAAA